MKDHAIYSLNNKLIEQYEQDNANIDDFLALHIVSKTQKDTKII